MSIEFKAILGVTAPYLDISGELFKVSEAKPMFAVSETPSLPESSDLKGKEILSSLIADDIEHYESLGVLSNGCASSHVDYHVAKEDGVYEGQLIRLKLFRVKAVAKRVGFMSFFRPREEITLTLGIVRHYVKGTQLVFTGCFIPPRESMCMKGLAKWYGEKRKVVLVPVIEECECRGFYEWGVSGFVPEEHVKSIKIVDGLCNEEEDVERVVLV